MASFFRRFWIDLCVCFSQWRLTMDRHLAESDTKHLWRILWTCLACTGIVGIILSVVYGSICLESFHDELNYSDTPFYPDNVFDAAYYLLFTNGGQNLFDGSHFLGLVFTTIGIVLIAFLTSAITNALERRSQRYLDGETTYLMGNHIVVFGASDYLYSIINEKKGINGFYEEKKKLSKKRIDLLNELEKEATDKINIIKKQIKDIDSKINILAHQKASRQKFLIVTSRDVSTLRREVFSFLDKRIDRRDFVFFFGDRTSDEDISKLSLERASEVFVIGDSQESDDIESYRDANNMECVEAIGQYLKENKELSIAKSIEHIKDFKINKKEDENGEITSIESVQPIDIEHISSSQSKYGKPLPCHVMFEYQTSFAAFQFSEISSDVKEYINFLPFNYYDLWARKVVVSGHSCEYEYRFFDTVSTNDKTNSSYITESSEETVHLIILGMSKMGIAMGLQAAQVCHYPNFKSGTENNKRTRITFIDSCADVERDYLKGRIPSIMSDTRTRFLDFSKKKNFNDWEKDCNLGWKGDPKGWYDIEWEFIKGRIESDNVQTFLKTAASEKHHIVTIAVCLPKSHQSMAAAMYMPGSVYEDCLQILTYQRRSGAIVNTLANTPTKRGEVAKYKKIVPFGMLEDGYDSSLDNDIRAMLVSYVYDSYYSLKEELVYDKDNKIKQVEWKESDTRFSRYSSGFIDWSDSNAAYCIYDSYATKWGKQFIMEKMSSAFNANTIETKLRGLNYSKDSCPESFTESEKAILTRVEHNRWNIEKMLTGYRSLTPEELSRMSTLWQLQLKYLDDSTLILDDDEKKLLETEFNWQISEQLKEENRKVIRKQLYKKWSKMRKYLKGWPLRAHLDICSCEELNNREETHIIQFDSHLSEAIPYILKKESYLLKKDC